MTAKSNVIGQIADERRRQIEAEGWTAEHDDQHRSGELAEAAAAYALYGTRHRFDARQLWPWGGRSWKPRARRRNLVRAAALIVAEIERLDRENAASEENETLP